MGDLKPETMRAVTGSLTAVANQMQVIFEVADRATGALARLDVTLHGRRAPGWWLLFGRELQRRNALRGLR